MSIRKSLPGGPRLQQSGTPIRISNGCTRSVPIGVPEPQLCRISHVLSDGALPIGEIVSTESVGSGPYCRTAGNFDEQDLSVQPGVFLVDRAIEQMRRPEGRADL